MVFAVFSTVYCSCQEVYRFLIKTNDKESRKEIQRERLMYTLYMTIVIVEYRCSDLLRRIIAKKVISSQSIDIFVDLLDKMRDRNNKEVKSLVKQFKEKEEEERKVQNNQDKQSEKWREEQKEVLKFSKIDIVAGIIKCKNLTFGNLIQIISGEYKVKVKVEKNKTTSTALVPLIDLPLQEKWRGFINNIRTELTDTQDDLKTTDSVYQTPDSIPQAPDPAPQIPDPAPPIPKPISLLSAMSKYRNDIIHDENKMMSLYNEHEERLIKLYVEFLHYVNFEEYFPLDLVEEKVRHLLNPPGTESDLVLRKYDERCEELEARANKKVQELAEKVDKLGRSSNELNDEKQNLKRKLQELKENNHSLRQTIDDRDDFRRNCDRERGQDIIQILNEISKGLDYDRQDVVITRMRRLEAIAQRMQGGSKIPNAFWETLMSGWRPLTEADLIGRRNH